MMVFDSVLLGGGVQICGGGSISAGGFGLGVPNLGSNSARTPERWNDGMVEWRKTTQNPKHRTAENYPKSLKTKRGKNYPKS